MDNDESESMENAMNDRAASKPKVLLFALKGDGLAFIPQGCDDRRA